MAEEFENSQDFGPEENGRTKRRMQTFSRGDVCTRKIRILRYILYPNRSRVRPDSAGQAYAPSKSVSARNAIEFRKPSGRHMPGLHASQHIRFCIYSPNRTNRPAETFANCLQDVRSTDLQIRRLSENARDSVLSSQPHVFELAFSDVGGN